MSAVTRIKRKTYATPRNVGTRRYFHVSTDYRWSALGPANPAGPAQFVKVGPGLTYRKRETA